MSSELKAQLNSTPKKKSLALAYLDRIFGKNSTTSTYHYWRIIKYTLYTLESARIITEAICLFLLFFFFQLYETLSLCIMNLSELDFRGHCDHYLTHTNLMIAFFFLFFWISIYGRTSHFTSFFSYLYMHVILVFSFILPSSIPMLITPRHRWISNKYPC